MKQNNEMIGLLLSFVRMRDEYRKQFIRGMNQFLFASPSKRRAMADEWRALHEKQTLDSCEPKNSGRIVPKVETTFD